MKRIYSSISVLVIAASFCFSAVASIDVMDHGYQNDSVAFIVLENDHVDSVIFTESTDLFSTKEAVVKSRAISLYFAQNQETTYPANSRNTLPYEVGWRSF